MRFGFTIIFLAYHFLATAQNSEEYLFPIQPGQIASLAGTLGELRSNHFHTGIDIRTNNTVGYPVYAAKSGYISRAGMSPGGYGNVLYVTHPDGNTTVYAHLESFKGPVAGYIKREQYRRKTFEIDLFFRKDQFPVRQGDTVALSGNTGSSSGPHLHFDIRDKDNNALDPLSFGFKEVADTLPPYTEKIALRTLTLDSRINDRFGRFEFYVQRQGDNYYLPIPILASGVIGIELLAKDKMTRRSPFYGGVNFIELRVDNQLLFKQSIDKLDLSDGRYINTLLSFRSLRGNNARFYKLYVDDGNALPFYTSSPTHGKVLVSGSADKRINIITKDVFGNSSSISLVLKPSTSSGKILMDNPLKKSPQIEISDNTFKVVVNQPYDSARLATAYSTGKSSTQLPAYGGTFTSTYLFDLRKGIIDSIRIGDVAISTGLKVPVPSANAFTYYNEQVDVSFPKGALYDTLYLQQQLILKDSSEYLILGDPLVPLHRPVKVSWKNASVTAWNKTLAVYRNGSAERSYIGGSVENGRVQFYTREFGDFTILRDTVPPSIKPVSVNGYGVRLKVKDDLSGIDSYEATINGQWLLMHLDGKSGTTWSEKLDTSNPLKGEFILTLTDRAGNKQIFTQVIP
jgi:hypothetical protein